MKPLVAQVHLIHKLTSGSTQVGFMLSILTLLLDVFTTDCLHQTAEMNVTVVENHGENLHSSGSADPWTWNSIKSGSTSILVLQLPTYAMSLYINRIRRHSYVTPNALFTTIGFTSSLRMVGTNYLFIRGRAQLLLWIISRLEIAL